MMRRLESLDLKDKRVLLRVDFNVPLSHGNISDDTRIRAVVPTVRYILDQGAKSIFLMSHLGRPKGKDPHLTLSPCAERLSTLLGQPVAMAPDCIGPDVEKMDQKIIMLENLRFYEGEENPEKDPEFVKSLARLGDVYINDAFGAAHRAHGSITSIVPFFGKNVAAGFLMAKEVEHLSSLLENPKKPFYAIIGGAKVSSKIGVIESLLKRVDRIYLGGGLAFPFLQAQGIDLGASKVSSNEEDLARKILAKTKSIRLPVDLSLGDGFHETKNRRVAPVQEGIPTGWFGLDLGPSTIEAWSREMQNGQTVFWNGPLGVFEFPSFAKGTFAIAEALAASSASVTIGGGDSLAAIEQMGLSNRFAYLSTGGGASLEFLEHEGHLPGIDLLCT